MTRKIIILVTVTGLALLTYIYFNRSNKLEITGNQDYFLTGNEIIKLTDLAKHGNSNAAFSLYHYYEFTKNDPVQSLRWLKYSAELGNTTAQYNLGVYYLYDDENRDSAKGLFWLRKAAANGNVNAIALLKKQGNSVQ